MDVTSENFSEAAAQLEALLPTCSFYAIDEEMTGIMLSKETAPNMADVCEQRYAKMVRDRGLEPRTSRQGPWQVVFRHSHACASPWAEARRARVLAHAGGHLPLPRAARRPSLV